MLGGRLSPSTTAAKQPQQVDIPYHSKKTESRCTLRSVLLIFLPFGGKKLSDSFSHYCKSALLSADAWHCLQPVPTVRAQGWKPPPGPPSSPRAAALACRARATALAPRGLRLSGGRCPPAGGKSLLLEISAEKGCSS